MPSLRRARKLSGVKLQQDQIWKLGPGDFVFIARLERLSVEYRRIQDLVNKRGVNHEVSKKEFCRLIKPAQLLSLEEIRGEQAGVPASESA